MKYVSQLLNGEDPLKDKRNETIRKMADNNKQSTERILKYIIDDNMPNDI